MLDHLKRAPRRIGGFIRRNLGRIAYYAALALVLCAIALAAEQYRSTSADRPQTAAAQGAAATQAPGAEAVVELPEGAQLLRGFDSQPVWNTALGFWEIHQASDYRLEGNRVACVYAGVVSEVGASGRLGGFVTVDSGWLRIVYASVTPDTDIAPGQQLEAGECFATADASLPAEEGMGAHLHIECQLNGNLSDFEALIGKNEHAYN